MRGYGLYCHPQIPGEQGPESLLLAHHTAHGGFTRQGLPLVVQSIEQEARLDAWNLVCRNCEGGGLLVVGWTIVKGLVLRPILECYHCFLLVPPSRAFPSPRRNMMSMRTPWRRQALDLKLLLSIVQPKQWNRIKEFYDERKTYSGFHFWMKE